MRRPSAARMSSSATAAAAAMRAFCALPCRSATTRNFSPASGSAASTIAPRPLDEHEAAALAARHGHAVRPGMDEQGAGAGSAALCGSIDPSSAGPAPSWRRLVLRSPVRVQALARQSLRQLPRGTGTRRAFAGKPRQPAFEVGAVAAEPALGDQHGEPRRLARRGRTSPPRLTIWASRTGSASRRIARPPSVMRPSRVDGAERPEQRARLASAGARRRIEEARARRIGNAERGAVQHHAGEVGFEDLRRREGRQRRGLLGAPQPDRDARLRAAGAAGALVGRGARHAHRLQPRDAGGRLVFRQPRQPAIDHHAHAVDGDRGLGDRGRQHHLAAAPRRRPDGGVLRLAVEHCRRAARCRCRRRRGPASRSAVRSISRWPGRKASTLPLFRRQRVADRLGHRVLDRRPCRAAPA